MALVQSGDRMAFACLIRRHEASVFRLIYRFFGKEDVANDLAQEVFLRVWRHCGKYNPTAKFTTWLYTVTANCCRSEAQSLWRRHIRLIGSFWAAGDAAAPEFPEPIAPTPSPEDALLQVEQSQLVLAAIRSLPNNQRLALVLKRYEELSYQEIAAILGCSAPAVDALLARAKASLLKKLATHHK